MNEVAGSEERGWAMAAIRVSDGTPYRYPFCLRLVK
jgi:uncharacterized Tic20 family protein